MSPPKGTTQPSGSSRRESPQRQEEVASSRPDVQGAKLVSLDIDFSGGKYPSADEVASISQEDIIDFDDDESTPSTSLPASAIPGEPLSASLQIAAALDEITRGDPGSTTTQSKTRRAGDDPAVVLRRNLDALRQQAQREVEVTRKAEAERAAATGQAPAPRPEKRNLSLSASTPTSSVKKVKGDDQTSGPVVMDMRQEKPKRNRPTSFDHLYKPCKLPCAMMIDRNEIIGNPFDATTGWSVKANLDPGKLGLPSIGLDFQFPKANNAKDLNSFSVGWEPGVQIGGQWMMENLEVFNATNPSNADLLDFTYPPAIKAMLEKKQTDKKEHADMLASLLVCATFRCNVHKTSQMEPEWAKALGGDAGRAAHANLTRMYSGEDTGYQVTMWFLNRNTNGLENFHRGCLGPLVDAVADHTPPFHQYTDENDEPVLNFNIPTVHAIGNESKARDRQKDATIQALQTAVDDVDRPMAPSTIKEVKKLQDQIKYLEYETKEAKQKLREGLGGDWTNILPLLNQQVNVQLISANKELESTRAELKETKAELAELRASKNALLGELQEVSAELEEYRFFQIQRDERFGPLIQQLDDVDSAIETIRNGFCSLYGSLNPVRDSPDQPIENEIDPVLEDTKTCDLAEEKSDKPSPQKPVKASKSPAEIEILRLKHRHTLHSLVP